MTEHEYLTAVAGFILTCPYPAPVDTNYFLVGETGINYGKIVAGQGSDRLGAGLLIRCTGMNSPVDRKTITGRIISRRRVNFVVEFIRSEQEDEYVISVTHFLQQLINWINEENHKRGKPSQNPALPKFGMTNSEKISADGNMRTIPFDDGRAIYQVQVHCDFELLVL